MPLQYPGEFVPTILWVGGVAGSSLAAHEAKKSAEPAAHKIGNQYNCRRFINRIILSSPRECKQTSKKSGVAGVQELQHETLAFRSVDGD